MEFSCDVCNKTFKTKTSLDQHVESEPKGHLKFSCDVCDKTFKTKTLLDQHVESEPRGHLKFSCDVCDKTFKTKRALDQHVESRGHLKFSCDVCDKTFKTKRALDQHVESEPRSHRERDYSCLVCCSLFFDVLDVTQHYYDSHCKNQCWECHRCFQNKHAVIKHMMTDHLTKFCEEMEKLENP